MIRKDAAPLPPCHITLDEARNHTPIPLQRGQAVTVDLSRHDNAGDHWQFSGVPQPSVTLVSAPPPPPASGPTLLRAARVARRVERYTWNAEQLAALSGSFSMTATYTRNKIKAGIFQFDFKMEGEI